MSSFSESLWSNVAAVLVASLCLGFFGLLYTKSIQYDELSDRVRSLEQSNDRFRFVAAQEIALLKTAPEQSTQVKVLEPLIPIQPTEELVKPVLELVPPPQPIAVPEAAPEPPIQINKSPVPRSEDDFRTEQRRLQKDFGVDGR